MIPCPVPQVQTDAKGLEQEVKVLQAAGVHKHIVSLIDSFDSSSGTPAALSDAMLRGMAMGRGTSARLQIHFLFLFCP